MIATPTGPTWRRLSALGALSLLAAVGGGLFFEGVAPGAMLGCAFFATGLLLLARPVASMKALRRRLGRVPSLADAASNPLAVMLSLSVGVGLGFGLLFEAPMVGILTFLGLSAVATAIVLRPSAKPVLSTTTIAQNRALAAKAELPNRVDVMVALPISLLPPPERPIASTLLARKSDSLDGLSASRS